ncbi:MAG: carboxylesterase family protein [Erysipelotrichaceae bacterium]|nr:carboxylesterase family protein [Erysipelotrichaceae bacterium]
MIELVKTKYGTLKAVKSNAGYSLFRGVPYAKPPVGELRWRAPEEPEKWDGIRLCDRYGDACAQFDRWSSATDDVTDDDEHPYINIENYPYPPHMSEDCLYLNIYTPADSKEDKLPVMIYIHGGGLQQWYGSDYEYCGDNFCKNGCVLVSVTYRLNIFGFLVHPELARESGHDASGNYGIMDQIQALRWVYENIEGFGGDPDNITVFGQSAGGRCSLALACSPLSRDMIRRISVQSAGGIGSIMAEFSREKQEKMGLELMQSLNCSSIDEMRQLKWEILRDANDKLGFFDGFNLYTDGYVIPQDIDRTLYEGSFNDIDIIIGCTIDEGANEKKPMFGSNLVSQSMVLGIRQSEIGRKPVYMYVFARQQPGDDAGVPHSCDNRYQFGTLDGSWRPYDEDDWKLSEIMQKYWAQFARTGDPNQPGLPEWKPFTAEERLAMRLDAGECAMHDFNEDLCGKLEMLTGEILKEY